jgi:hypothetical protein
MFGKGNPVENENFDQKVTRVADSFWGAFQMTENGRVKSTLLLYSFCLCWVFIAVYGASFALLLDPLDAMMAGAPVLAVNLVEALVPSALGTAVCGLSCVLFRGDRRLMPAAYLWVTALLLACFIVLLCLLHGEGEAQLLVLQFFGMFALPPVLLGGGLSAFLYYRHWKHHRSAVPPAKI